MSEDRAELLKSLAIDRASPTERAGSKRGLWIAAFAVAAVAGGALAGWLVLGVSDDPDDAPAVVREEAAPIRVAQTAPAERRAARGGLVASGYVVARRRATVSPQVSGQLLELYVEEGARVEKGQALAQLDDEVAALDLALNQAQAQSAEANVAAVEADLREAVRNLRRVRDLEGKDFSTGAQLDLALAREASLQARLAGAKADAAAARARAERQREVVERHVVRAPFDGVVIDKNAQPGEFVAPASAGGEFTRTGVYTLVDMASLELEIDVNEGQIGRVRVGQNVEAVLDAYPNWTVPARVAAIIPTANRDKATIVVRVAFDALDDRILPEMAAKVTFLNNDAGEPAEAEG